MYKIDTLNLKDNLKVNQGFLDILGKESLTNVEFSVTGINIDVLNKSLTISVQFTANNFIQQRDFKFEKTDLGATALNKIKSVISQAETFILSQPELANVVKL